MESFLTAFEKLDEKVKDDADAIHNALSVVENVGVVTFLEFLLFSFTNSSASHGVHYQLFLFLKTTVYSVYSTVIVHILLFLHSIA